MMLRHAAGPGLLLALLVLVAAGPPGCAQRLAPPRADAQAVSETFDTWLEDAMVSVVADAERVLRLANRVRVAGAPLCGERVAPLLGVQVSQRILRGEYPLPLVEGLLRRFDVGRRLTVTLIDPDSPAARAGVQSGDRLLRANGRHLRRERHLFGALRDEPAAAPRLDIERAGARHALIVPVTLACAFEVHLDPTDALSTWRAENDHAVIGRGLLSFTRSDDELAILIAHELGHRALGGASRPEQELGADAIAFEMAATAGFDVAVAPGLYERLALEKPWLVVHDPEALDRKVEEAAHGRLAERLVAARRWLAGNSPERD